MLPALTWVWLHAYVGAYKASETSLSEHKGHSRMKNYLSGKGNCTESRHSTFSLLQEAHCTTPQAQLLGHQWDNTLWEKYASIRRGENCQREASK